MAELLHSLGINWPVMVAQAVNFAILLAVLGKFVYKPVLKMLDERREGVRLSLEREEHTAKKLAAAEVEREKILGAARVESQKIIEAGKQDGESVKKKLVEEARSDIAKMRLDEDKRRVAEKIRLLAEARRELGAVVVEAIERSFGDVLDARAQGKMVEQALAVIREANAENPKHETLNSKQILNNKHPNPRKDSV